MHALLSSPDTPKQNGVYQLSSPAIYATEQAIYLRVRQLEGRLYEDEIVRKLPLVPGNHVYANEWIMRADSAQRLHAHIASIDRRLTVADIGCGNGWMSNRLAELAHCQVVGLDINQPELEQGARVFAGNGDLSFAHGDVMAGILADDSVDIFVMAASLQYFENVHSLLPHLSSALRDEGEIHILDTPFYDETSQNEAIERSRSYYEQLDVPEMSPYYHHHLWSDLKVFQPTLLYHPDKPTRRLRRLFFSQHISPFAWIMLKRS